MGRKAEGYRVGRRSQQRLEFVHPSIIICVPTALHICEIDFTVGEGARTLARQKELVASGASWTLKSRHLVSKKTGLCYAADLWALDSEGEVSWAWPLYYKIAEAMKEAARFHGVPLEWGGDWSAKRKDGPHWQLPARAPYL